jgi:hypothetical protein
MKKKRLKTPRATDEELVPCMDYLHGDVADNEFEAACFYEYATESAFLREAARLWAQKKCSCEEIPVRGSVIWQCPSFPQVRWNQLSQPERAKIRAVTHSRRNAISVDNNFGRNTRLVTSPVARREQG